MWKNVDYRGFWPNMAGTWSKDCCFWSLRRPLRSKTSLSPQSYTSCLSLLELLFGLLNPSMPNELEDLLFLFNLIQTYRTPPFFCVIHQNSGHIWKHFQPCFGQDVDDSQSYKNDLKSLLTPKCSETVQITDARVRRTCRPLSSLISAARLWEITVLSGSNCRCTQSIATFFKINHITSALLPWIKWIYDAL